MSNPPGAPSPAIVPPGPGPKLTGSKPKDADGFSAPVDWLLGRELLTYLRSISLYSSNGSELDHRDWMHPEVIDLEKEHTCEDGAFWFDYMADSGDGQLAMYSLAYVALGDLWKHDATVTLTATPGGERLPRGGFLFLGGDTAYHVSNRATLAQRFSAPFDWAHQDRVDEGTLGGHAPGQPEPILFAIPGNHDYYDSLLGFNHLFRYNTTPHDHRPRVADFARRQDTSFVFLKLPFGWWFWGLDTQNGRIDWRQKRFVLDHCEAVDPKRLIVCTPEPTTVFGHVAEGATGPFRALGLPRPFINGAVPADDHIHLDIAGDVHHYARHSLAQTPNYASVVSGGGGAFLHSTHTKIPGKTFEVEGSHEIWPPPPKALYPDEITSCRTTNRRLLRAWRILRGGYVWAIGAICASIIYFGAAVAPNTRVLSTKIGQWLAPLSAESEEHALHEPPRRDLGFFRAVAPALFRVPPVVVYTEPKALGLPLAEVATFFVIVGAMIAAFSLAGKTKALAALRVVRLRAYVPTMVVTALAPVAVLTAYNTLGGIHECPKAHPFLSNLMILLFALPLPTAWLWISTYVPTLPKQAKYRVVTASDYLPAITGMAIAALSCAFGLLVYGVQAIGQTVSDLTFVFALAFVGLGPASLGWFQAGAGRRWPTRLGFALLGLYLGVLQISIPLLLALDGSWWRALVVCGWTLAASGATAAWFSTLQRSKFIWLIWLFVGSLTLAASMWGHSRHEVSMLRLAVAFVAGAALTCVWFGWYLASALAFGGHNNEAGGAAQIDRHRHFIRFKVQKDRLTGYVIGIAEPGHIGRALPVHLVEVFELVPKVPTDHG